MPIRMKRIYAPIEAEDGKRILVDRLWPRGASKLEAKIDVWPKILTPSNELRKWYHQDMVAHRDEFKEVSVGTEVHIKQSGLPDVIPVDGCYLGWQESLQLLAFLVNPDIPDE